jgi:phage baseplate assembly protein W
MINGFTTSKFRVSKTFRIFDIDVISRSLLNYIMTIKGERPHMPNYGTRIPLLAFKPIDQMTLSIIKEDLTEAVRSDPRVELIDYAVMNQDHTIKVFVDLKVKSTNQNFKLEFPLN